MIILQFAIIFFFFLIMVVYFIFLFNSIVLGHDLSTNKRVIKIICKIIQEQKPDAKNFYDLGCARGTLSLKIKEKFPQLQVFGNDKDRLRIFLANMKAKYLKTDVTFSKKNIFDLKLKDADIVYTYLWYSVMPPLEKKLLDELKPGAIAITNESFFPTWRPTKVIDIYPDKKNSEQLFIYIKM